MGDSCLCFVPGACRRTAEYSFFQEPARGLFWKTVFHRLYYELGKSASLQILELEAAHPVLLGAEPL